MLNGNCTRERTNIDTARGQRTVRRHPQPLRKLEEQPGLILQYRDFQLIGRDARIVATNAFQAVHQLARNLDTREAAADDNEVAQGATKRRITFQLDTGDTAEHGVAGMHRVADGLERQCVLGQSRDQIEPGAVAECEHSVLVANADVAGKRRAGESPGCGIDRHDAAHDKAAAGEHLPDRCHDLLRKDRRAYRFRQHRIEGGIAFLADQD